MTAHTKGTKSVTTPKIALDLTTLVENSRRFSLVDKDLFEDANATADTDRWDSGYIIGTEGGAADINTTTAGKLYTIVDPDATPTAAAYGVTHKEPLYSRYYQTMVDMDATWGVQTAGTANAGIMLTKGSAFDATNYLWIGRYKTSGTDVIRVDGKLNNTSIFSGTPTDVAITDDVVAFKIERLGDEYRFYYSTSQDPVENWVFVDVVDDSTANYMTNGTSIILFSQSSGTNTDNSINADFDNWKSYISDEGLDELIGIVGRDNADNAFSTSSVAANEDGTLVERLQFVQDNLVPETGGLVQYGVVTTSTSTTKWKASALAGKGANVYNDVYYVQFIEADNAAPEGEVQKISAYDTSDGDFTVGAAYTAQPAVGDQFVVLHESLVMLGRNDVDNVISTSTIAANEDGSILERLEQIQEVVNKSTGTAIASTKSLVDAIGATGSDAVSHDYSHNGVVQYMHGHHAEAITLFVIPEAVASINTHNTAIQTELAKLGEVVTITQADALTYPDFEGLSIVVLGTNNGTAWTTTNLANIKTVPNLPILCVDSVAAAYLEIGTDGGAAATKTAINAVANIKGSLLGTGYHDTTGLAVGANTVSSSATYNTLDMSDANITETWYAYETANANTDVVLGEIRRIQPDGTIGIDETGAEVDATIAFYGCAYSANDLNTLGKSIIWLLVAKLIQSRTIGQSLSISGNIGNLQKKIFGNTFGKFSATKPLAAYIAGNSAGLGTEMPNSKALYDILWVDRYEDAGNTTGFTATAAMTTVETDIAGLTNGTALTGTTRRKISYWLDMSNYEGDANTPNCTIRVKAKIDETNYRTVDTITWTNGTSDSGLLIEVPAFPHNLQVTFENSAALDGDVVVPYKIMTENLEY